MADLHIRDLDDEVKNITDELARAQNLSTAAYVRALLTKNAAAERQRKAMREADERITDLRTQLHLSRLTSTGATLVREARDEYERDENHRDGTE